MDAPTKGTFSGFAPNLVSRPKPNETGIGQSTFTASDGELVSAPATIRLTIEPMNDPPTATGFFVSSLEDTASAVKDTSNLRLRTFLNCQNCFRTIIGEAFGIRGDTSKFDYRQGGNQKWIERIDGIRLERVTPGSITDAN